MSWLVHITIWGNNYVNVENTMNVKIEKFDLRESNQNLSNEVSIFSNKRSCSHHEGAGLGFHSNSLDIRI